jgi:Ca-activated chloride channel homolog
MEFKTPWVLLLIPAILVFVAAVKRRQRPAVLRFSSLEVVTGLFRTWKTRLYQFPFYLRTFSLLLFCIALAGPRSVLEKTQFKSEGIDIVLAIDASGSMAAEDFEMNGKRVNRLAVVKSVVQDFIDERRNDRIGIVAFAGQAYTVSPLTTDNAWLQANLERVNLNLMEDGTAIGSAMMSSLERLKKSNAKSKIVILLTDGMNNAGKVEPLTAAQAAKALSIKFYTIGAGTKGFVPYPVQDIWGRKFYQNVKIDMDETVLKKIADLTGGKYFRATDTESLRDIYREIDKLEKTEIEQVGYREYKELFGRFLWVGLVFLMLELILSHTFLLRLP